MNFLENLCEKGFYTMAMIRTLACIIFLIFSLCSCSTNKETTSADHIDCFVTPEGNRSYWCFDHEVSVPLEPKPELEVVPLLDMEEKTFHIEHASSVENSQMEGYFKSKKYLSKRVSR